MGYFINVFILNEEDKAYQLSIHARFRAVTEMLSKIDDNIHLLVKHVRATSSRYYFLSNAQILRLCSLSLEPEEFLSNLRPVFAGIEGFNLEAYDVRTKSTEQSVVISKQWRILAVVNEYKEEIRLDRSAISFVTQEWEDPPTFTLIKELEAASVGYIKTAMQASLKDILPLAYNY